MVIFRYIEQGVQAPPVGHRRLPRDVGDAWLPLGVGDAWLPLGVGDAWLPRGVGDAWLPRDVGARCPVPGGRVARHVFQVVGKWRADVAVCRRVAQLVFQEGGWGWGARWERGGSAVACRAVFIALAR